MPRVSSIWRFPVKGLSGEQLSDVTVEAGQCLPFDRRYAVARGSSKIDTSKPDWAPKANFLQLMRHEKLAVLETRFDPETETLTILRKGRQVSRGKLTDPVGQAALEQFFVAWLGDELRSRPRVVKAPSQPFTDVDVPFSSFINLASVKDIERVLPRSINPLRFRGNFLIEGLAAWEEFNWVGHTIAVGDARFRVEERIGRCAATNVDPSTGERDMTIPLHLERGFRHTDCGIYATCTTGGIIREGDGIAVE